MKKKLMIGVAVVLVLVVGLCGYVVFFHQPDGTAMTNQLIMMDVQSKNMAQARATVDLEYGKRQLNSDLRRFWDDYIDACERGVCPDVVQDMTQPGYGAQAAYAIARHEATKRFQAPPTRIEEKTGLAADGVAGEQYTFTFEVAPMPALGCMAIIRNVGEHTWHIVEVTCAKR